MRHYQALNRDWQKLRKSTGDHAHGALCGNGAAIYRGTRDWKEVDCPACIERRPALERAHLTQ